MNDVERLIDMTIPRVGRGLFVDIAYFFFSSRAAFLFWSGGSVGLFRGARGARGARSALCIIPFVGNVRML